MEKWYAAIISFLLYFTIKYFIHLFNKKKEIIVKKDDNWKVLWYGVAKWTDKGTVTSSCIYTIKYYPDTHEVELIGEGKNNKEHPYYNSYVVPMFYWAKRCLDSYDKQSILQYIKNELSKKAKGTKSTDLKLPEDETIESIKQQIEQKLIEEDYLEVKRLQDKLDKLENQE